MLKKHAFTIVTAILILLVVALLQIVTWDHITQTQTQAQGQAPDPLAGKTIVMIGDSQMYGEGWTGGWANILRENHPDAKIHNLAVSGSYLTAGGIYGQLGDYLNRGGTPPDILIVDGGGNDMMYGQPVGETDADTYYPNEDHSTPSAALETLFFHVANAYPECRMLYITMPRLAPWEDALAQGKQGMPNASIQSEYWDALQRVCKKYAVPCVDLFSEAGITTTVESWIEHYFIDGLHMNEKGYRLTYNLLEEKLRQMVDW